MPDDSGWTPHEPPAPARSSSHETLGLFDTPPTRTENAFALAIVAFEFVAMLCVLPVRDIWVGAVPAFVPTFSAVSVLGELIVATLLYAQAAVFRSRALSVLASGYVLTGLLLIPYALTFPGAFAAGGVLHAGVSTAAWVMIFRRFAMPLSVSLYVLLKQADSPAPPEVERASPRAFVWVFGAAALALALTGLATVGQGLLPPMFLNTSVLDRANVFWFDVPMIALLSIAIGVLWRRRSSVLDTWLLVSLATVLIQTLLNMPIHARFTLGWYCLFVPMSVAHLVVLLALIAESNRLYVRLAVSTASRRRERDARLMSMDGVAAAISHEIGQPLVAVSLSARAALNALEGERPDAARAIRSLQDTLDAAQRALAVSRSVRCMFGKKTGSSLSEFDINDLVRESVTLLDRELAVQRVSLRLALAETLPPIMANRVQIQQVLSNLLINAIESLAATTGRARRIVVGTVAPDCETVRVEISDSGPGVALERMAQIFDPFFTTKSSGTGLGLSLSRTIVEDHGGRLWASRAVDGGAMFHVELHRSPAQASGAAPARV